MFYKILKTIIEIILFVVLLIVVLSVLPVKSPVRSYLVVSGSMEPEIKTGSLVFTQSFSKDNIKAGDIISFLSPKSQNTTIVHRVHNVDTNNFISTKGDNNNFIDDWQISRENISGKTFLVIPYIGRFFNLVHTPIGFIFIIGLPSLLFIFLQAINIKDSLLEISNKKNLSIIILFLIPSVLFFPKKVLAIFFDTSEISQIKITVKDTPSNILSSEITSAEIDNNKKIKINYTSESDFDQTKICYSYNSGPWSCFLSDKLATFDPPSGDGIYYFNILVGKLGQFEIKDYTQDYLSFQLDSIHPTSSLDLEKSLSQNYFYLSKSIYDFSSFSLNQNNLKRSLSFSLPQKLSSFLYFTYDGLSSDTCDFTNLSVLLNNQTVLQTGPQELGLGRWIDSNEGETFLYQLPVFDSTQNISLDFVLSDTASSDSAFTISNLSLYPTSLRVGGSFTPIIISHDIGSGVGETNIVDSGNNIIFNSVDIVGNQESNQSVDYTKLPDVVLNEIRLEHIDLYKNIQTSLSGYFLSNLTGETYPVVELSAHLPPDFFETGTIFLHNSQGEIIDRLSFGLIDKQIVWRRNPDGVGTWSMSNKEIEGIFVSLDPNRNTNKVLMTISNIPSLFGLNDNDYLEYTLDYQSNSGAKQIYGKVYKESVENKKVDREFYLGTCSSGNSCKPENISIGETLYLTITGQSDGNLIDKIIWQVPF